MMDEEKISLDDGAGPSMSCFVVMRVETVTQPLQEAESVFPVPDDPINGNSERTLIVHKMRYRF